MPNFTPYNRQMRATDFALVEYREELPGPEDFLRLFAAADWRTSATPEQIAGALAAAWYSVVAYAPAAERASEAAATGDDSPRLIAMGHILSDGVIHAYIADVIVDPEWQGRGVGREVMRRLVARCEEAGIESIQLFAAPGKARFYEKLGFSARSPEAPGMELRPQP